MTKAPAILISSVFGIFGAVLGGILGAEVKGPKDEETPRAILGAAAGALVGAIASGAIVGSSTSTPALPPASGAPGVQA